MNREPLGGRHPGGARSAICSDGVGATTKPLSRRERGWGEGLRYQPGRTLAPHPFAPGSSLPLGCAQALSRREREAMRGVCAKSPYRRSPNPSVINPLIKSPPQFPAPPPSAPIIPPSRRPGARSAGDPQRRRERMERAQPGAGSRKGSLAEGMRGRAGWKAGRPRGRGGYPHRSRRWSLPSLPAVCRRTPRQQRGPRSAHVEACPRGASDVRRNGIFSTHRAHARRSAHAPITAVRRARGASACALAQFSLLSSSRGRVANPGMTKAGRGPFAEMRGFRGRAPHPQCAPAPSGRCCFSCLPTRVTRVRLARFMPVSTTSAP